MAPTGVAAPAWQNPRDSPYRTPIPYEGDCDDDGGGWSCSEDDADSFVDDIIWSEQLPCEPRASPKPGSRLAVDRGGGGHEGAGSVPGVLAQVLTRIGQLKQNGILIQGVGIIIRHLLALYGLGVLFRGFVSWRTVLLAISLWVVSGLGVTAGAHRLWTHQSYHATPVMEALLMIMFSIADQGTIVGWSLTHAMHHSATDTPSDPHNRSEGFWHAHFGWLYSVKRFRLSSWDYNRVISGLGSVTYFHDAVCLVWDPLWSMGFPALVASFWGEAWAGFFFAGAFRWACVQHITFFVNSVAHGEREPGASELLFDVTASGIGPRVSLLTTLLALGEGWHDYHHIFPWDYAAAELDAWDQWNPTKVFIDICSAAGIVSTRRRCSPALQQARRRQMMAKSTDSSFVEKAACKFKVEGPVFFRRRVPDPVTSRARSL